MNRFSKRNILLLSIGLIVFYLLSLKMLISVESANPSASIKNLFDAVWFSVVTFTTVGYGDYYPITVAGRLIGYLFIISSLMFYGLIIGQFTSFITRFRENKKLGYGGTTMENHIIIIGWNSFGRSVTDQLIKVNKKVAVVTETKDNIELIHDLYSSKNVFTLFSDFNNFELISKVNPTKASIVFINFKDDTRKLVYVLNMKKAFPGVRFAVTIDNASLKSTFTSAGVTHTICKNEISSKLLASYIFEPDVASYSEDILSHAEVINDYDIKQFKVLSDNPYLGKGYQETFLEIKRKYNCLLIGLAQYDGKTRNLIKNPKEDITIKEGDYLIVLANNEEFLELKAIFRIDEGIFID